MNSLAALTLRIPASRMTSARPSKASKAYNKYFTMVRPYFQSTGTPSILYGLNTDFVPSAPVGALAYTPPTGMFWGSMIWGQMVWGGSLTTLTAWQTVGSVCNAASVRLKVQNNGSEVRYTNTDFLYQKGTSVL